MKRRRTTKSALLVGVLGLLIAAFVAFRMAQERLDQYPDGPPWARRVLDARMARAIASQRIVTQTLEIEVHPGTGRLQGHGVLDVECGGAGLDAVCFVLNPGLNSFSASCAGRMLPVSRQGGFVRVALPKGLATGERTQLAVSFSGSITATSLAGAEIRSDEVWLPWTACWHPVDFGSFAQFDCTVTIAGEFLLAGDAQETHPPADGRRTYRIRPARKCLGIPLVAGRYSSRAGVYGDVQCTVYFEPGDAFLAEPLASSLPRTETALRALLGGSDPATHAILSRRVTTPEYLGLNAIALPREPLRGEEAALAAAAAALAHKWWGGTVSPVWYPLRPDGGAWLIEGLTVHSGWSALRELKGRGVAQEYVETQFPQPVETPLRTLSALELARSGPDAVARMGRQGALLARWLESGAGREAYWEACRNVLRTHGGSAITLDAFRHALELSSERDLGEVFRVWFDRAGLFDYGVGDVSAVDGSVRVTISSHGDIPALQPLTVGIVTARGVDLHAIEPGVSGGTFTFTVDSAVNRVTLDPYFETPDVVRANNTWPRRDWPVAIAANSDGAIAVAQVNVWESCNAETIRLMRADQKGAESIRLPAPLAGPLLWSPANGLLAFGAGQAYVRRDDGRICALAGHPGSRPAGWLGEQVLVRLDGGEGAGYAVSAPPFTTRVPVATPETPVPGTVACGDAGGPCVFVSNEGGKVWAGQFPGGAFECVLEEGGAIGAPALTCDGAVRVFTRTGAVLEFTKSGGAWSRKTLLELGHSVEKPRFAPGASRAVWQEAGGRLLIGSLEPFATLVVRLGESCVDFDWQDADTLVCLTRTNEWSLPGRFHAVYTIQRVDASTGQGAAIMRFPAS